MNVIKNQIIAFFENLTPEGILILKIALIAISLSIILWVFKIIKTFFKYRKIAKTSIKIITPKEDNNIKRYYELQSLLTPPELKLFHIISSSINTKHYYVIPQTSLLSLMKIKFENDKEAWAKISNRRLDFLITDKNFKPILAIELDDKSHDLPHRQKRDIEVEEVLSGIGLKLVRFKLSTLEHPKLIHKTIKKAL